MTLRGGRFHRNYHIVDGGLYVMDNIGWYGVSMVVWIAIRLHGPFTTTYYHNKSNHMEYYYSVMLLV